MLAAILMLSSQLIISTSALSGDNSDTITPYYALGGYHYIKKDGVNIGYLEMWTTSGKYQLNGEVVKYATYTATDSMYIRLTTNLDVRDTGASNNGDRKWYLDILLSGTWKEVTCSNVSIRKTISLTLDETTQKPDYAFGRGYIDSYYSGEIYEDW